MRTQQAAFDGVNVYAYTDKYEQTTYTRSVVARSSQFRKTNKKSAPSTNLPLPPHGRPTHPCGKDIDRAIYYAHCLRGSPVDRLATGVKGRECEALGFAPFLQRMYIFII